MTRTQKPLIALVLIGLAALVSACGSSATASSGTGATTAGVTSSHEKAVTFARCMRSHGVSAFPDPGASGAFTIEAVANGSSLDTNTPAFSGAISACKPLEPSGFMGAKRSSQQQAAGLAFAQCIRRHGVKDFPDPLPNGPLVDTNRIPSTADPGGMSSLNAAMRSCHGTAAAAGVTR